MIDYIRGTLTFIDLNYVVLETNGIGYQVLCGNPFQFQQYEGQELQLYTYQYVREDQLSLYGFQSREERLLFTRILNVSGIGPKGALAILASGHPEQVISAVQAEDVAFLTKFPGIGKKTAQRLILDLKDKLDDVAPSLMSEGDSAHRQDHEPSTSIAGPAYKEAAEALIALGYSEKEIEKITPQLKKQGSEEWTTDQYIKFGLQLLLKETV